MISKCKVYAMVLFGCWSEDCVSCCLLGNSDHGEFESSKECGATMRRRFSPSQDPTVISTPCRRRPSYGLFYPTTQTLRLRHRCIWRYKRQGFKEHLHERWSKVAVNWHYFRLDELVRDNARLFVLEWQLSTKTMNLPLWELGRNDERETRLTEDRLSPRRQSLDWVVNFSTKYFASSLFKLSDGQRSK